MTRNALPREFDVARILADYEERISFLERARTEAPFEHTGTLTSAAGWSISLNSFVISGSTAVADFHATRTGGNISVPSDGNIPNTTVATIDDSRWWGRSLGGQIQTTSTGPMVSGYVDIDGRMRISSVAPNATVNTSDTFRFSAIWLVAVTP